MEIKLKVFIFITLTFFLITIPLLATTQNSQGPADSPWPMFMGNSKHTGLSPYNTSHVNGTIKWKFETGAGIESSPVIGQDGTIYIGSHDNNLYAVNPDGTLKWKYYAGKPISAKSGLSAGVPKGILSSPAVGADETVYAVTQRNFLFALDSKGKEKWRFKVQRSADTWSSPAIGKDGTIYIGSAFVEATATKPSGGKLFAINPDGTEKWHWQAESDIFPTPGIADDGTIYAGAGASGKFSALSNNGSLKWQFQTKKHVESSAAIGADGTLYFGSWDNNVYAIKPDGTEKWHFKTKGDGIVSTAAIGKDGTIYITANDGIFYALSGKDGIEKWKIRLGKPMETSSSAAIGADGTIYVGYTQESGSDKTFFAINPKGTIKWSLSDIGSVSSSSPAIGSDGTIYVGSWDGNLYAISDKEQRQKPTIPFLILVVIFVSVILVILRRIFFYRRKK